MVSPENELSQIRGFDRRFLNRLHKLKIFTVKDLIHHFPSRYEDFSRISPIADLGVGQTATIFGRVKSVGRYRTPRKKITVTEAVIGDETGAIKAVWFNQPYIAKTLFRGKVSLFSGKAAVSQNGALYLSNPAYGHQKGLLAVYPETKGLTSKGLRYLIKIILKSIKPMEEFIPAVVLKKNNLPDINSAFRQIHFPRSLKEAENSKRRFAFEDIFLLQLHNLQQRLRLARQKTAAVRFALKQAKEIAGPLPFSLTPSQKQAMEEIFADIRRRRPMNRLLQGDVGSGKTVVAAAAALLAAESGLQAAFMAPTEVLARQHYQTLTALFSPLIEKYQLAIGLLTGSESRFFSGKNLESKSKKKDLVQQIAAGFIHIVIGTHAVIQKNVRFKRLALAIIDEQHRFGVRQRALLTDCHPHLLSMSATPIPRTLTMTLFGDLDLSLLTELPAGRRPIITKIVSPARRSQAYQFIRQQIKGGRQAFVICPRIETKEENGGQNGKLNLWREVKAVEEEFQKLSQEVFPDLRIGMLHGRLPTRGGKGRKSKQEIMEEFKNRQIDILVSTSVVEIGVDVPNASIMMIEDADRFGLAQLYQFRGRVGRGKHQSYCLLFTNSSSAAAHRRLRYLLEAKNGFELAEKDLALRGPGQFLGESQTGLPDLAMDSLTNAELIKIARDSAEMTIKDNPKLDKYPQLKEKLENFRRRLHQE